LKSNFKVLLFIGIPIAIIEWIYNDYLGNQIKNNSVKYYAIVDDYLIKRSSRQGLINYVTIIYNYNEKKYTTEIRNDRMIYKKVILFIY
jgi:hypothetical protein